jgi:hypothetical protein
MLKSRAVRQPFPSEPWETRSVDALTAYRLDERDIFLIAAIAIALPQIAGYKKGPGKIGAFDVSADQRE